MSDWAAMFLGATLGGYLARTWGPRIVHRLGHRRYVIDVTEGASTIPGGGVRGDARVVTEAPPVVRDLFDVVTDHVQQDGLRTLRVSVDLPRGGQQ